MSQQGEKPAAHEDDWWRRLYDEAVPDTGPGSAPDSLDDRFDSVSDAVSRAPDEGPEPGRAPGRVTGGPEGPGPERGAGQAADPLDHRVTVVPVPVPDPRASSTPSAPEPPLPEAAPESLPVTGRPQVPPPTGRAAAVPDAQGPGPADHEAGPARSAPEPPRGSGGAPSASAAPVPPSGPARCETSDGPAQEGTGARSSPSAAPVPPPAGAAWDPRPAPTGPPPTPEWPVPGRVPRATGPGTPPVSERPGRPETPAAPPSVSPAPPVSERPGRPETPAAPPAPEPPPVTGAGRVPAPVTPSAPEPPPAPSFVSPPPPAPERLPASEEPLRNAPEPPPTPAPPDPRSVPTGAEPPPARVRRPQIIAVSPPWEAPGLPKTPPVPRTFAVPLTPEPPPEPEPSPQGAQPSPEGPVDALRGASRPVVGYLGDRPPTYDAEPAALPACGVDDLDALVPDTVLDGARYGTYTLRAASVRGDSARFRGEPRRDALLTARFGEGDGALVLVAVAGGTRAARQAHLAAADACRWIGGAVARSHARLSDDIRAGRRGDLKSGLHRLTDRTYGKLRARAAELGLEPSAYTAGLRCLLLPADPDCRTRVFFGVGEGGLFRLRDGSWQDLEPLVPARAGSQEQEDGPAGDRLTMDLQITTPPSPYAEDPPPPPAEPFRFRASVARPGDTLLLCGSGLAEPMHGAPELAEELAGRWAAGDPPGLPAYLADVQLRVKGYADDRTAAAVWEA